MSNEPTEHKDLSEQEYFEFTNHDPILVEEEDERENDWPDDDDAEWEEEHEGIK